MSFSEMDYRCGRARVQATKDWRETHEAHGATERVIEDPQPSSYTIATLVCPCGARHYTIERNGEREVKGGQQ